MPGTQQDSLAGMPDEAEFEDAGTPADNKKPVLGWQCEFFSTGTKQIPAIIVLSRTLRRAAIKAENWAEKEYGQDDWHLISVTYRADVIP